MNKMYFGGKKQVLPSLYKKPHCFLLTIIYPTWGNFFGWEDVSVVEHLVCLQKTLSLMPSGKFGKAISETLESH